MGSDSFNLYLAIAYPYSLTIAVPSAGIGEFFSFAKAVFVVFEFKLERRGGQIRPFRLVRLLNKELGAIFIGDKVLFLDLPLCVGFYFFGSAPYEGKER